MNRTWARRVVAIASVAIASVASACGPTRDQDEAQRVLNLIDALRNSAPHDDETRLAVAHSLARLEVHNPAAVRARDACAKAYETLAQANQASAMAMQKMSADQVVEATQALAEAQTHIDESKKSMPECNEATAALRTTKAR